MNAALMGRKMSSGYGMLVAMVFYGVLILFYQIQWLQNGDPEDANMLLGDLSLETGGDHLVEEDRGRSKPEADQSEGLGKSFILGSNLKAQEGFTQVVHQKMKLDNLDWERVEKEDEIDATPDRITRGNRTEEAATVIPLKVHVAGKLNASSKSKVSGTRLKNSTLASTSSLINVKKTAPMSIAQMNTLLHLSRVESHSKKRQLLTERDRELLAAKLKIQNGPELKKSPGLHPAIFRNISTFLRSYDLMERTLKIYVYKEGDRPIFHQPNMRGIYSAEGWFMKLLEGNHLFTVRDPKKAHLFYLPFSSQTLKIAKVAQNLDVQALLNGYVKLISQNYAFWNRTNGADHFFVGCHDQAYRFTMHPPIANCIKVLCNANAAAGFIIGKDSSLPSTYIRSIASLNTGTGGNPAKERPILAFFAGGLHGYVRRLLLHHWENKEPDMKIYGPQHRGPEGRVTYAELMKSSKYCICARGYAVFSPRVVESIWHECVPVIIADNYVPPFFEVLDWEAFSVFVREDEIPNLRSILLAIPEEKYTEMQQRVKMVQQHFLWHRKPAKYDLFHMILHSVWHYRLLRIPPSS